MKKFLQTWRTSIQPHIPHLIRHDFWRKLFALFFAALISWYAHANIRAKMEFDTIRIPNIPVKFVPNDPNINIIAKELDVDVVFSVPKGTTLKNTDFFIEYPVAAKDIATNDPATLTESMVRCNLRIDNLNVESIHPDLVPIDVDILDKKDVPAQTNYDISELLEGYTAVVHEPEKKVTLHGPRRMLATIDSVETEKIPLANVTKSFSRIVEVIPPYKDNDVSVLTTSVKVDVDISKAQPLAFDLVPIQVLSGENSYNLIVKKIQPGTVSILVDRVPNISQTQVHPFVDVSNITRPGVYSIDIKCWADNDRIKIVNILPAKTTVTLETAASKDNN